MQLYDASAADGFYGYPPTDEERLSKLVLHEPMDWPRDGCELDMVGFDSTEPYGVICMVNDRGEDRVIAFARDQQSVVLDATLPPGRFESLLAQYIEYVTGVGRERGVPVLETLKPSIGKRRR